MCCAQFDVANRQETTAFDDLGSTKLSKKQGRGGRFGGLGAELGGIWGGFGMDDDDDERPRRPGSPLAGDEGSSTVGGGGLAALDDEPTVHVMGGGHRRGKDVVFGGGFGMVSGLTADLRKGGELPEGLELIGGDPLFEEQEDGSQALVLPEGSYLKVTMPYVSPWSLEDDGRLHSYSLMVAMRLDRMPQTTQPIFNGGGPPSQGEQLEHVQAG